MERQRKTAAARSADARRRPPLHQRRALSAAADLTLGFPAGGLSF